jgi:hypothetical protein
LQPDWGKSQLRLPRGWIEFGLVWCGCPLRVISGHNVKSEPCPLYPQYQTLGASKVLGRRFISTRANHGPCGRQKLSEADHASLRIKCGCGVGQERARDEEQRLPGGNEQNGPPLPPLTSDRAHRTPRHCLEEKERLAPRKPRSTWSPASFLASYADAGQFPQSGPAKW